jgi:hypothetical protein
VPGKILRFHSSVFKRKIVLMQSIKGDKKKKKLGSNFVFLISQVPVIGSFGVPPVIPPLIKGDRHKNFEDPITSTQDIRKTKFDLLGFFYHPLCTNC